MVRCGYLMGLLPYGTDLARLSSLSTVLQHLQD